MNLTPLKYLNSRFCKIIKPEISIHRNHPIEAYLVCTFYDKQINAKKYQWKFVSVQVLLVGYCRKYILKEVYLSDPYELMSQVL